MMPRLHRKRDRDAMLGTKLHSGEWEGHAWGRRPGRRPAWAQLPSPASHLALTPTTMHITLGIYLDVFPYLLRTNREKTI